MTSSKNIVPLFSIVSLLALSLPGVVVPAKAAALPASRCVTAASQASHAKVISQLEKDVAPYAKDPNAAAAIRTYREEIAVAWQALEEPYCGYGSYGASSAIKSYTKSTTRTRAAFLANVKNFRKVQAASTPAAPIAETKTTVTTKPPVQADATLSVIPNGLERGMRTEGVKALQKFLARHFNIPTEDLVTGYFGPTTEGLVIKFQLQKKIILSEDSPGAGRVGPKTSSVLNSL